MRAKTKKDKLCQSCGQRPPTHTVESAIGKVRYCDPCLSRMGIKAGYDLVLRGQAPVEKQRRLI